METKEVAIQLSGVKKMYKLGQIGGGTLQGDLQSWWAKVRGKEDPNSKIGTDQRSNDKTFMALNGIDLTVYKGEALGIIGGNGAGKSTMLKLLSRVTAPTEGEIDIYGRIASMLEVGTGFNGEMTGRENVYMNGAILGMTKAEIDAKMEDIIEFSEVREFIDTPVKRYSSGMYVKLAFSVAAHLDSEIMIMDEVLAVGDMAFQKKCLDKMRDAAKKEGRTVLYVSHNMNTIRQLCDRCVVLDKGKVVFEGGVEEAINIYSNTQSYNSAKRIYTDRDHRPHLQTNYLRLLSVEYIDKAIPTFEVGEPITMKFLIKNSHAVSGIGIRFEVKDSAGTPVGVAVIPEAFNSLTATEMAITVRYNFPSLAPGNYQTIYVFFQGDKHGNGPDLDCVSGMDIYIKESKKDDLAWRTNYWGNIKFDDPKVIDISLI